MEENSQSQPQASAPNKRLVLCIEDEQFIGELYKRALEKSNYSVEVIADGYQGLAAALTDKYDFILLDIMIPEILGIDILQQLRTQKPDLKAKIIIATNLEQDKESRARIEESADGYFIKAEVTPRQLADLMNQM